MMGQQDRSEALFYFTSTIRLLISSDPQRTCSAPLASASLTAAVGSQRT